MLKKQLRNAKLVISILFIFIGLFLISYDYFNTRKTNLINKKNIELYETNIVLTEEIREISNEELSNYINPEDYDNYESKSANDYIGILDVPKVNIHRGFVSMDSEYNSINYNVMLVNESAMPNIKNGNLILAAHRGNTAVSFFDKLYLLELGDLASVTYKNKKYTYKLVNYYLEERDGNLSVRRNKNKTCLTLITCTRGDKLHQTVYIFELESVE